jgi:hypothetical protein
MMSNTLFTEENKKGEFFDHHIDPYENKNLANNMEFEAAHSS